MGHKLAGQGIPRRLQLKIRHDVGLPLRRVRRGAGHDDLDLPALIVVVVPFRSELHDLAVQIHADPTAHAHHHALALHRLATHFVMLHDVPGDELRALLAADQGFELGPLGLQLLPSLDSLVLGSLLEVRVDLRPVRLVELMGRPLPGRSSTVNDPHVDERLQVLGKSLRNRASVYEDAGLHVLLKGMASEVRTRDEGTCAVHHRDLRVNLAVDERFGFRLPREKLRRRNT